jgi:hypothetical protein
MVSAFHTQNEGTAYPFSAAFFTRTIVDVNFM